MLPYGFSLKINSKSVIVCFVRGSLSLNTSSFNLHTDLDKPLYSWKYGYNDHRRLPKQSTRKIISFSSDWEFLTCFHSQLPSPAGQLWAECTSSQYSDLSMRWIYHQTHFFDLGVWLWLGVNLISFQADAFSVWKPVFDCLFQSGTVTIWKRWRFFLNEFAFNLPLVD